MTLPRMRLIGVRFSLGPLGAFGSFASSAAVRNDLGCTASRLLSDMGSMPMILLRTREIGARFAAGAIAAVRLSAALWTATAGARHQEPLCLHKFSK